MLRGDLLQGLVEDALEGGREGIFAATGVGDRLAKDAVGIRDQHSRHMDRRQLRVAGFDSELVRSVQRLERLVRKLIWIHGCDLNSVKLL